MPGAAAVEAPVPRAAVVEASVPVPGRRRAQVFPGLDRRQEGGGQRRIRFPTQTRHLLHRHFDEGFSSRYWSLTSTSLERQLLKKESSTDPATATKD